MKEVEAQDIHPRIICHRESYNGSMLQSPVRVPNITAGVNVGEFELPPQSFFNRIPINSDKYTDIVFLSKFCEVDTNKQFYRDIPHKEENEKMKKGRRTRNEKKE